MLHWSVVGSASTLPIALAMNAVAGVPVMPATPFGLPHTVSTYVWARAVPYLNVSTPTPVKVVAWGIVEALRSSIVPVPVRKYAYRLLRSGSKPTSPVSVEKRSFSWKNAFWAVKMAFRFALASLCFDRAWNLMKFGIAIAARIPMIATTIISSMSVKPFWTSFFIGVL